MNINGHSEHSCLVFSLFKIYAIGFLIISDSIRRVPIFLVYLMVLWLFRLIGDWFLLVHWLIGWLYGDN